MEKNNYFVKWKSELVYNELQNTKYRKLINLKKIIPFIPKGCAHGCYAHEDSMLHIISDKKFDENIQNITAGLIKN